MVSHAGESQWAPIISPESGMKKVTTEDEQEGKESSEPETGTKRAF